MVRFLLRWTPLLALLAAVPTQARVDTMGALADVVLEGQEVSGPWRGSAADGFYVLENRGEPDSAHYYYALPEEGEAGRRSISVRVDADYGPGAGPASAAGLLYGYQAFPKLYYAYVLYPSGEVALYRRQPSGTEQLLSMTVGAVRPGQVNELAIVEEGEEIALYLNGSSISSLSGQGTGEGGAGIIAIGTGRFRLADFRVESEVTGAASEAVPGEVAPEAAPEPPPEATAQPEPEKPAPQPPEELTAEDHVYLSLAPESMEHILSGMGLSYERSDGTSGNTYYAFRLGSLNVSLQLFKSGQTLLLDAAFTLNEPARVEQANAWNAERLFSRAYVIEDRYKVEADLNLRGGVTGTAIEQFIITYRDTVTEFARHIGFF